MLWKQTYSSACLGFATTKRIEAKFLRMHHDHSLMTHVYRKFFWPKNWIEKKNGIKYICTHIENWKQCWSQWYQQYFSKNFQKASTFFLQRKIFRRIGSICLMPPCALGLGQSPLGHRHSMWVNTDIRACQLPKVLVRAYC